MRIKQLRQRKAELIARADALLDKQAKDGLTEEENKEYETIEADLKRVNSSIEREERLMDEKRTMEGVDVGNEPDPAAAKPADAKKDTAPVVHVLGNPGLAAFFDSHGNKYRSFTDYLGRVRAKSGDPIGVDGKKPFTSFGEQLRAIAGAAMNRGSREAIDPRLKFEMLDLNAASGANESIPSEGGYLVQSDFSTAILDMMHDMGDVLQRVRRIPISAKSNGILMPAIDETSRVDGSRWGGVLSYWADEADTVTATKPKFREIEMRLKKLFGLGYATDELLADATALEAVMTQAFSEELVFKSENAIVNGDGAGKPLGFLNSGAVISIAKDANQPAATVSTANILNMWARLPRRSRTNAVWLINQDAEPQLYPLTLGAGTAVILLYTPPGANGNGSDTGLLLGRPVIPTEYNASLGTAGDIVLADLSQYLLIDKGGVQQSQSMHVRFIYDEMTFRFIYRLDGQPAWRKPVTPFQGSNTQSPFIALAARP